MKKLLTLCFFAVALLLGTQSITAQNLSESPEAVAKEKTHRLSQEIGLNGDQQRAIWRAFLSREKAKLEIARGTFSDEEVNNINKKVDDNFHVVMQENLSEEQYSKFKQRIEEYL